MKCEIESLASLKLKGPSTSTEHDVDDENPRIRDGPHLPLGIPQGPNQGRWPKERAPCSRETP